MCHACPSLICCLFGSEQFLASHLSKTPETSSWLPVKISHPKPQAREGRPNVEGPKALPALPALPALQARLARLAWRDARQALFVFAAVGACGALASKALATLSSGHRELLPSAGGPAGFGRVGRLGRWLTGELWVFYWGPGMARNDVCPRVRFLRGFYRRWLDWGWRVQTT